MYVVRIIIISIIYVCYVMYVLVRTQKKYSRIQNETCELT